jgi:cytochrome c peroxidase
MRLTLSMSMLLAVVVSCSKKPEPVEPPATQDESVLQQYLNLPAQPFEYANQPLPAFFLNQFIRIQDNTPASNQVTNWGATLGRVLFYDKRVSANYTISCSSCHAQEKGFADDRRLSLGFNGGSTGRHSMSLINARYYINGRFFWDERAATLEEQVLMPVQDHVEMGMRLDTLVLRLNAAPYYPILFRKAFGSTGITSELTARALAQFVRSIISYRSRYDEGRAQATSAKDDFINFSIEENFGKNIFLNNLKVNCAGCHNTEVMIMDNPRNNGLYATNSDEGIKVHTDDPLDAGKFKAPSLKSVALRKTYMHDGSVSGLESVVEHYNSGIQANPTLDHHIQDNSGQPSRMGLSAAEVAAVVAFLHTLTDDALAHDEKFSDPFR